MTTVTINQVVCLQRPFERVRIRKERRSMNLHQPFALLGGTKAGRKIQTRIENLQDSSLTFLLHEDFKTKQVLEPRWEKAVHLAKSWLPVFRWFQAPSALSLARSSCFAGISFNYLFIDDRAGSNSAVPKWDRAKNLTGMKVLASVEDDSTVCIAWPRISRLIT